MTQASTLGVLAWRARMGLPLQGLHIVDCHAHLGPLGLMHVREPDADQIVALLDRLGIEAYCPSANVAIGSDYRWGNDRVAEAMLRHPGRILGYIVVNPNYAEDVLPEIERCLARAPFIGLKFHPAWHDYPPDGPNYEPALVCAHERGLVVLSHSWGSARYLEQVSCRFPGASFIQAHTAAGWKGRVPVDYFEVARWRHNVYLDTALSLAWYGAFERLIEEAGSENVVFGTDCPFEDPALALGRVVFARLSDAVKERILGLNMLEILARRG
jgi:predicted TIM-barrel fold metal-dependent hydrolase